ncbi:MAG: class I SAM-dependent methyltransferase [Chloroflexota bacterium]
MIMQKQYNINTASKTISHYATVATSYNQSYFLKEGTDYQRWELEQVQQSMRLNPEDKVVDLGCGTGVFSSTLYMNAGLSNPVLAVEPSQAMLDQAQNLLGIKPFCANAVTFAQQPKIRYDKILMKGMIHHVPLVDLPQLYRGVYQQLRPQGLLLTVTRPTFVHYPFFPAALAVWEKHQPPAELFVEEQERAGFSVSYQTHSYPVYLPKQQWFAMIRSRFWSTFSYFDDNELRAGIAELEEAYADQDYLSFTDELIFITAVKH